MDGYYLQSTEGKNRNFQFRTITKVVISLQPLNLYLIVSGGSRLHGQEQLQKKIHACRNIPSLLKLAIIYLIREISSIFALSELEGKVGHVRHSHRAALLLQQAGTRCFASDLCSLG